MLKELAGWSRSESCSQYRDVQVETADCVCPQGSQLGVVVFNIFGGGMASGIECTLSSTADDTELSDAVEMPEEWDAIQRNLVGLRRWSHANFMKVKQDNCDVLCLVPANPSNR